MEPQAQALQVPQYQLCSCPLPVLATLTPLALVQCKVESVRCCGLLLLEWRVEASSVSLGGVLYTDHPEQEARLKVTGILLSKLLVLVLDGTDLPFQSICLDCFKRGFFAMS